MTQVISRRQIERTLAKLDTQLLIKSMEDGFVAYSSKQAVVPPVGHLSFQDPAGDMHVKYGYIQGDEVYVVKVASSFYGNPKQGLPSSNGTMLVLSQKTGELRTILLDEGYLTEVRTGLAGAVVAKYLAPTEITAIGIVGAGTQARFQLQYLKDVLSCRKVYVYGRSKASLQQYAKDMASYDFEITPTQDIHDITNNCNYIVTTTPAMQPLIMADQVRAGTHITAVGADTPGKQELDPQVLGKADIIVADSVSQCSEYGEVAHAFDQKLISTGKVVEFGDFIKQGLRRESDDQITIADLTGIAVQDIQIAKFCSSSPAS